MKVKMLRESQAVCKANYAEHPETALLKLKAEGEIDFANLAVNITHPAALTPAGLHPAGGGDGTFACPVEIMLAGLAGCAGVTFAAVATSMQLKITTARVIAAGEMDFRGTLAVEKTAPVGMTSLELLFEVESTEPEEKINKLIDLTHRYCVVHRTLDSPPKVEVEWIRLG